MFLVIPLSTNALLDVGGGSDARGTGGFNHCSGRGCAWWLLLVYSAQFVTSLMV